jgi:hypothetical protein
MNEIKDLLTSASIENLATQEVLLKLIQATTLLVAKVEELEARLDA